MSDPIRDTESAVRELGALPVPTGTATMTAEQRAAIAELIGDAKPATAGLLEQLAQSVRDRREHEHPTWEDLYCLNLVSWAGERLGPVLRRVLDAEADRDAFCEQRNRLAETNARLLADLEAAREDRGRAFNEVRTLTRERDTAQARYTELESAVYGAATLRLLHPVEHARHLHDALAAQMARAETLDQQLREAQARVVELEAQASAVRGVHVKHDDSDHCRHDGEPWPCPTIAGSADALPVPVGSGPRLTAEREREIRSLDLLEMMSDRAAPVISGHLAALLGEVGRMRARLAELEAAPLAWAAQLDSKSLDNFLIALASMAEHEPMGDAIDRIHELIRSYHQAGDAR
jgi:chaperonin cofactor prefoldin